MTFTKKDILKLLEYYYYDISRKKLIGDDQTCIDNLRAYMSALEDGTLLEHLGITDIDQKTAKELHHELRLLITTNAT